MAYWLLMPNRPEKKKPEAPRKENIIALTSMMRKFKPGPLVNEKQTFVGEDLPDRDELAMAVFKAIYELNLFTKAHEGLQQRHSELKADAIMAHMEMQKIGLSVNSLAEGFETVCGRHTQALDIINNIVTADDSKAVLEAIGAGSKFLGYIKKRNEEHAGENIIHLAGEEFQKDKLSEEAERARKDAEALSGANAQSEEADTIRREAGEGGDGSPEGVSQ